MALCALISNCRIEGTTFANNQPQGLPGQGAGLLAQISTVDIQSTVFTNNQASGDGAAVYCSGKKTAGAFGSSHRAIRLQANCQCRWSNATSPTMWLLDTAELWRP